MATKKATATKTSYTATADVVAIEAHAQKCGFAPVGHAGGLRYFSPVKTPTKAQFKAMRAMLHAHCESEAEKGMVDVGLIAVAKGLPSREAYAKMYKFTGKLEQVFTADHNKGWQSDRNKKRKIPLLLVFGRNEGPRSKRRASKAANEEQQEATQEADKLFG